MGIKIRRNLRYLFENFQYVLLGIFLILIYFLTGSYRRIGFFSLTVICFVFFWNSIKLNGELDLNSKLNLLIIVNIFYLVIQSLFSLNVNRYFELTIHIYLVQLIVYMFLLLTRAQTISLKNLKLMSKVYSFMLYILLIYIFLSDISLFKYSSYFYYQLPNLLLVGLSFILISNKNKAEIVIKFVLIFVAIYLTNRRTPLFVFFVFLFTYFLWGQITKSRKIFNLYFIIIIVIAFLIPFIYLMLSNPDSYLGNVLSKIIKKLTHKRLFSGRNVIWPYAIELIKNHYFFGSGIGATLDHFYGIYYSTHNLFFFILIELGIVGLMLFIGILYFFWDCYFDNRNPISKISGSLLITLIIQQTFSLGLISGKMGFAFSAWILLVIGTYPCNNIGISEIGE